MGEVEEGRVGEGKEGEGHILTTPLSPRAEDGCVWSGSSGVSA